MNNRNLTLFSLLIAAAMICTTTFVQATTTPPKKSSWMPKLISNAWEKLKAKKRRHRLATLDFP